jgi:PKD repeat protein
MAPAIESVTPSVTGWTNGDVTVTVDAADASALKYSFDEGASWDTGNELTYTSAGEYTVTVQVRDAAGNIATASGEDIVTVQIDKTAPQAGIALKAVAEGAELLIINSNNGADIFTLTPITAERR